MTLETLEELGYRIDDPENPPPKDGTQILLRQDSYGYFLGWYDTNVSRLRQQGIAPSFPWAFIDKDFDQDCEINGFQEGPNGPTHWMPIPKPPKLNGR